MRPQMILKSLQCQVSPKAVDAKLYFQNGDAIGGTIRDGSSDEMFALGALIFDVEGAKRISAGESNDEVEVSSGWSDGINLDEAAAMAGTKDSPVLMAQVPLEDRLALVLIDGHHRMFRAWAYGEEKLPAYVFTPQQTMELVQTTPALQEVLEKNLERLGIEKSQPGSSDVHVPVAGEEERIGKVIGHAVKTALAPDPVPREKMPEPAEKLGPGAGTNDIPSQFDMQQVVEGMDWEMDNAQVSEPEAYLNVLDALTNDPSHYRKLMASHGGWFEETYNTHKDTRQEDTDPFENVGYSLDLGCGPVREGGHIGLDTYPYDYGTVVHDLSLGIPFEDGSCSRVRLGYSLEEMDDPKALLSEVHRVLMPGGQFIYEGPNDIYNAQEWRTEYPGFVLTNSEQHVGKEGPGQNTYRQEFSRIASPDPATAQDSQPRTGVASYDSLPADALLAADAVGYFWSDATSSGPGNRRHGYPSQGAMVPRVKEMGSAGGGGWSNRLLWSRPMTFRKDIEGAEEYNPSEPPRTKEEREVAEALRKPQNPNPPAPAPLRGTPTVEKILKTARVVQIVKANSAKRIVYGVVLAPNEIDAQDDVMTEEDIERSAHQYLRESRVIGAGHERAIKAHPVESFIAPQDMHFSGQYGEQDVKKGSWVLGVKVDDPSEWAKVESGEYTGFSVGGMGNRQQVA